MDAVSIGLFEQQWRDNLYKLWNRMSSGSYFPGPVRGVEIPKDHGAGVRLLGVPNTADRVAQTAAAMLLEENWSRFFTPTVTVTVLGAAPMTRWPYAVSGAGSRTGCSILTSGPFSIPFRMPCCSRR